MCLLGVHAADAVIAQGACALWPRHTAANNPPPPHGGAPLHFRAEAADGTGRAAWTGPKGGRGGFEGKLYSNATTLRGFWFDADTAGGEGYAGAITVTLAADSKSWTAKWTSSRGSGGSGEWKGEVLQVKRDPDGKLIDFGFKNKDVFGRLTANPAASRAAWVEAQRAEILAASVPRHFFDGQITYIPSPSLCDPFDDTAVRRHQQHSRHRGKQLGTSVVVAAAHPAAGSAEPEADPYIDSFTVNRKLRQQARAQWANSPLGAKLAARGAFRPTTATAGVRRDGEEVFLSPVDHTLPPDQVKKLAETARRTPTAATMGPGRLEKGADGKLAVHFSARAFQAGFPHWVVAAEKPLGYMPDPLDARAKAERAERDAERAKLGARPAFSPVGPRMPWRASHAAEGDAAAAPAPSPEAGRAAAARPATAPAGGRPAFVPVMRESTGVLGGFPEHLPDPYLDPAQADRQVQRGKRPTTAAAADAAAGEGSSPAAAKAAKAAAALAERPGWKEVRLPERDERFVSSVAMHPVNLAKLASPTAGH
jgi:hypothetical protein